LFGEGIRGWEPLGAVEPTSLRAARGELRVACALVQSAYRSAREVSPTPRLEAPIDEAGDGLECLVRERLLASPSIAGGLRLGVCLAPFALHLRDREGALTASFPLAGKTLEQAIWWLQVGLVARLGELPAIQRPAGIEDPILRGEPFLARNAEALRELGCWLANAHRALLPVSAALPLASAPRFAIETGDLHSEVDLAPPASEGAPPRRIRFGLRLGDAAHQEPYFYVIPTPRPLDATLTGLSGGGIWHFQGFFGAVAPATRFLARAERDGQDKTLQRFLGSAVMASRQLLHSLDGRRA